MTGVQTCALPISMIRGKKSQNTDDFAMSKQNVLSMIKNLKVFDKQTKEIGKIKFKQSQNTNTTKPAKDHGRNTWKFMNFQHG